MGECRRAAGGAGGAANLWGDVAALDVSAVRSRSVARHRPGGGVRASIDPDRHPVLNAPVKGWRAFRRLTQLSFPRSYPIVQFPNAPLILAFASGLLAHHSHGLEHSYAQAVSYLSMAIWAYLELFHGVNAFRRLLGLTYTISTAVHLANALHHH
jgi:hypothetical protein